jgi:hypothetical protein
METHDYKIGISQIRKELSLVAGHQDDDNSDAALYTSQMTIWEELNHHKQVFLLLEEKKSKLLLKPESKQGPSASKTTHTEAHSAPLNSAEPQMETAVGKNCTSIRAEDIQRKKVRSSLPAFVCTNRRKRTRQESNTHCSNVSLILEKDENENENGQNENEIGLDVVSQPENANNKVTTNDLKLAARRASFQQPLSNSSLLNGT